MTISKTHYDIVWPISPPPVPTYQWTDADWLKYCMRHKPTDYNGDPFDKKAWEEYKIDKQLQSMHDSWPNLSITYIGNNMFNIKKKEG